MRLWNSPLKLSRNKIQKKEGERKFFCIGSKPPSAKTRLIVKGFYLLMSVCQKQQQQQQQQCVRNL